jgi:hypothetical protein
VEPWHLAALVGIGLTVGLTAMLRARFLRDRPGPAEILRTTPRASVADAEEGATVAIIGTVRQLAEAPLKAPISGIQCVAYSSQIQRTKATSAIPWIREKEHQDFLIIDETGDAALIPHGRLVLNGVGRRVTGSPSEAAGDLAGLLNRHGHSSTADESKLINAINFEELILPRGTKVIVRGVVHHDAAAEQHDAALTLLPSDKEPVLIVDDPRYF